MVQQRGTQRSRVLVGRGGGAARTSGGGAFLGIPVETADYTAATARTSVRFRVRCRRRSLRDPRGSQREADPRIQVQRPASKLGAAACPQAGKPRDKPGVFPPKPKLRALWREPKVWSRTSGEVRSLSVCPPKQDLPRSVPERVFRDWKRWSERVPGGGVEPA